MTDQKLVERAREIIYEIEAKHYPCIDVDGSFQLIAQALQAHGEEVRRKTVEECAKVALAYGNHDHSLCGTSEAMFEESISNGISTAIRKLLEVKGA